MRPLILTAATLSLAALSAPVAAQDALPDAEPPLDEGLENSAPLDRMAERLSDPQRQAELAMTLSTLGEVLLDLPLAPLVEPLAEAMGEPAETVDPDMTLRRMAPGASEVPRQIERRLPQAMDSMARMSSGMAAMLPALREMAERLEQALPPEGEVPPR